MNSELDLRNFLSRRDKSLVEEIQLLVQKSNRDDTIISLIASLSCLWHLGLDVVRCYQALVPLALGIKSVMF